MPNRSNRARYSVFIGYTGPQFRALLNFPYGLIPEVAASRTDEQRSLLGYRIWNGYEATNDYAAQYATPGIENAGILVP